jgi:uncharacterized protein (DUF362 family)
MQISRRKFNRLSALAGVACLGGINDEPDQTTVPVTIVKGNDRKHCIQKAVSLLRNVSFKGKDVYLKCSYNSPDPYPATTHPETLRAAAELIKSLGSQSIILAERSGMGSSRQILETLGALELLRQLDITFLPLDEMAAGDWQKIDLPGSHWKDGIEVPKFLAQKACVVQVCNLKTHRFGGQFSASLKNSIGLIAKYAPTDRKRNYMQELHISRYQCQMIAEVNQVYSPELLIMDAMQVFVKGGPESGELASPGIIAASRDRVALDAVGVGILQQFGSQTLLDQGAVFEQEQLKRAAELKLGVQAAKDIRLRADDKESRFIAAKLANLLNDFQ